MRFERLAPAKVNLFLHVGALQADGYHPVSSLMTFADVGDVLSIEPWPRMAFAIEGPMRAELNASDDNLVVRAREVALRTFDRDWWPFRLTLDKRLPIAAGVGGGSADAAAALVLMGQMFHFPFDPRPADIPDDVETETEALRRIAGELGADVPICLMDGARLASGRGDVFDYPPPFPALDAVLVNPGVPCPTGQVFRGYDDDGAPGGAAPPDLPPPMQSALEVAEFLSRCRNDLQQPAVRLVPQVGEVLQTLEGEPETLIARMSGSGATCFALCPDGDAARDLALRLGDVRRDWWVRSCRLQGFCP